MTEPQLAAILMLAMLAALFLYLMWRAHREQQRREREAIRRLACAIVDAFEREDGRSI